MAEKDICWILDTLAPEYNKGAYPGRSSEGLNPEWSCDPFHVLIATILSQRTRDDNTRKASDNLFHKYDSIEELAEADPGQPGLHKRGLNGQDGRHHQHRQEPDDACDDISPFPIHSM